ncbi:hypothetical protein DL93DRAFT_2088752 [Clavulina sp. PMI_390]|nr:hypothetical protein DL93DRAFT_2088752 [Clavulina sp. PMI_390]
MVLSLFGRPIIFDCTVRGDDSLLPCVQRSVPAPEKPKSAKKARKAAAAAAAAAAASAPAPPLLSSSTASAPDSAKAAAAAPTETSSTLLQQQPASAIPPTPSPTSSSPTNGIPPSLRPATLNTSSSRRTSSPAPPSSRFQPTLPDNLPHTPTTPQPPPSASMRKRKASQDLITPPLSKELKYGEDTDAEERRGRRASAGIRSETSAVMKESVATPKPDEEETKKAEKAKKKQNAITRTIWTLIMIGGFISILLFGHAYVIVLVFVCQTLAYREVTALFKLTHPSRRDQKQQASADKTDDEDEEDGRTSEAWDSTLNWYFFAITNYFLYGESLIYYFKHVVFSDAQFLPFATNHRFISFMLYTIGFVGFVGSLKRRYLKHQFGLFGWVHMSLLVLVVSSHFIVNNILEGLIWFFVPASLVICNDIWAYICGVTFGKTPLIKLSPKKTVEGFVGAFICTLIFAVLWGSAFMQFNYMICPVHDLGTSAWSNNTCTPNSVFIWRTYELWAPLNTLISSLLRLDNGVPPIPYTPFQLHCLVLATFASLVAPFGGFFASGFKRAFNLKDFGDSIPGHGGMTDRMDCQFLMGMFSYVYYSALVREHHVTVGSVLQTVVSSLTVEEQVELFFDLKRYLEGVGVALA